MTNDDLERQLAALRSDFQGLIQQHQAALERIAELEATVEGLEQQLEYRKIGDELLANIAESSRTTSDERTTLVVETLRARAAVRDPPKHSLDSNDIANVLQGKIHRPNVYPLMDHIEDEVGRPDVCYKVTEPRGSKQNTRLVIDLTEGDVPDRIAGQKIEKTPIEASGYGDSP